MQIQILCVGKIKDSFINDGIAEFQKRLRPYARIIVTELADVKIPVKASQTEEEMIKEKEGELLFNNIYDGFLPVVLDVHSPLISSEEFAKLIGDTEMEGKNICFIIGGPLGFSHDFISKITKKISFSRLTFTHTMCRLILFEQIYRAFRILNGEPYHK